MRLLSSRVCGCQNSFASYASFGSGGRELEIRGLPCTSACDGDEYHAKGVVFLEGAASVRSPWKGGSAIDPSICYAMVVKHELHEVESVCPIRENDTVVRQQQRIWCWDEAAHLFSLGPCWSKSATRALIFVGMESRDSSGNSSSSSVDGGDSSKLTGLRGKSRR